MINENEKNMLIEFKDKIIKPKIKISKDLLNNLPLIVANIPLTQASNDLVNIAKKIDIFIDELWRYENAYKIQPKRQDYIKTYLENYINSLIDIKEIIEEKTN